MQTICKNTFISLGITVSKPVYRSLKNSDEINPCITSRILKISGTQIVFLMKINRIVSSHMLLANMSEADILERQKIY